MSGESYRRVETLLNGTAHALGITSQEQSGSKKEAGDAPSLIEELSTECLSVAKLISTAKNAEDEDPSKGTVSITSSLLFLGDHSLLKIVSASHGDQDKFVVKSKELIFKLIKKWMKEVGWRIRDYAQSIREVILPLLSAL